ncbi:metallophosphoesterase [Sphingomonas sp. Leaf4]|uniref:metallophosphoesterase n=1 Tax=Sphingomonas sp. Leaf4 TaxID=2876553 RepID=UPI001E526812|nr:metallophosphoesterase [Sphingomonas sp. Leaf4]
MLAIDTSPFVERYRSNDGVIGSNTRSQDTAVQLAWLDATLSGSRAKWKVVTGHHPIRSGGSGHGDQPEIIERVLPILKRHGVQAYIAGHDHDLQHIRRDGIDMIQCGGGMEARPVAAVEGTRFCRAAAGFGMVQVAGDLLSFDLRDERGASLYNASVPVRAAA